MADLAQAGGVLQLEQNLIAAPPTGSSFTPPTGFYLGPAGEAQLVVSPFGAGQAPMNMGGRLYTNLTGVQPGATGADKIMDFYTLPAGFLTSGRYIYVYAWQLHASGTGAAAFKVNWAGTGAVGATVTGGTNLVTVTGATSTGVSYEYVYVYYLSTAHQQFVGGGQTATTAIAMVGDATSLTADMTAAIQINLIGNFTAATTDGTCYWMICAGT